jgi:hypothetical protein
MSEKLTERQARWLLWRMTILYAILYSVDSLTTSFVSVMIDTNWSELSGTQQWIRVALIIKAWVVSMLALLTNAADKVQNNEFPIGKLTKEDRIAIAGETTRTKTESVAITSVEEATTSKTES